MLFQRAFLASAVCASFALAFSDGPSVKIDSGTVEGESKLGVESFNGIPFAKPPVGPLRLKPPQPYDGNFGRLPFNPVPDGCPQFFLRLDPKEFVDQTLANITNSPLFQEITKSSEDCLTLNVQRPVGVKAGDKLAVLVYIFGGGFLLGSNQLYSGAGVIEEAVKTGKPIVYVAINYRVGGFGFLGGKEIKKDGSSNLGLRDQRLALEWVADNIEAFGGDPEKVTIWGESAGAISVYDQTIINGGDNTYKGKPLFRAGIMNSGSVVPANDIDSVKPQRIYDTVVSNSGCKGDPDTLACLRRLPTKEMITAFNSVPGLFDYSSLDLSYLPRPDPGDNFFPQSPEIPGLAGKVARVPIIIGDQEDEGTLFSLVQFNVTTTMDLEDYLSTYFLNADSRTISELVDLYPDTPIAGSPFGSGIFNEIRPEFKRLAAILGDLTFTITRRSYLTLAASALPATWSYLNTYFKGTPILGTFHGSDLLVNFFGIKPEIAGPTRAYYVAFATDLDPNTAPDSFQWPKWTTRNKQLLEFSSFGPRLIDDDFRSQVSDFILQNTEKLRI
ncbi:acetylcholinesterase/Butyrylcholinesterase [Phyllosticta capitalensis]|uniref:Carboxylic ester hydrolase n=1 Tax=Phyllosticta capitalensis TaxID=121624 RepID=A0ABR1YWZ4_9PEZI